ncbi:MAG: hypothetical protein ACYCV7_05980 [Acidimicrobiales bacterium]
MTAGKADAPTPPVDMKAELRLAVGVLDQKRPSGADSMTSDLSIDEELILHSIGWEPVELVSGVSLYSVPMGIWNWGQGEIAVASAAYARSFQDAVSRIHRECAKAGGHGVVGVQVDRVIHRHHIDVMLLGTAVRPVGARRIGADHVFVSDLSARDFTLLHVSGWQPLGLAVGASFVYAPRRSLGRAMQQKSQNVELTNFTEAMYAARESAMERMQSSAISLRGSGVVEVKVTEGPMDFARHAIRFEAWGTVVHLVGERRPSLEPLTVVPLDDPFAGFAATSLRG